MESNLTVSEFTQYFCISLYFIYLFVVVSDDILFI